MKRPSGEKAGKRKSPKRPYATPRLCVHGDLEELTRKIAGSGDDGLLGSRELLCP